jgi:DNA-binding HxlR family transcriptional regulator
MKSRTKKISKKTAVAAKRPARSSGVRGAATSAPRAVNRLDAAGVSPLSASAAESPRALAKTGKATARTTAADAGSGDGLEIGRESVSSAGPDVGAMVESIVGCKWSLHVLEQVRRGVNRPGALQRSAAGLTSKVLSERLDKMVRFGILSRKSFPEIPPRVEYQFTPFGSRFLTILDEINSLKADAALGKV